jgi:hypothetical protein
MSWDGLTFMVVDDPGSTEFGEKIRTSEGRHPKADGHLRRHRLLHFVKTHTSHQTFNNVVSASSSRANLCVC